MLAGAVTHLVWDAFTHEGARGVRMLPALDESMVQLGRHHLMGARLMQDASSFLGLIVVLAIVLYGLRGGASRGCAVQRRLRAGERCAWTGAYVLSGPGLQRRVLPAEASALTASLEVPLGGAAIAVLRGIAAALLGVTVVLRFRLHTDPAPGLVRGDT